jgi:hypothetical protein
MKKLFTLFLFFIAVILNSNAQTNCDPATITNVEREGSGNRVTWTMPAGEEKTISQCGDLRKDWSTGSVRDFAVFHRFRPEDLSTVDQGTLTQVVFAPSYASYQTGPGHTYTIQIYKGGSWGIAADDRNPGTLISSQALNNDDLLFNAENTITLENTIIIDASQELWIGLFCTNIDSIQSGWKLSVGLDKEMPYNEGLGNIIFIFDEWITLHEENSAHDYNWFIKGKVQTIDGSNVNLYFNDNKIDSLIPGTTYFHSNPTGEAHCYQVEVNCWEGGISPLSNEFCIPGVGISNYETNNFTIYPNPAKDELRVEHGELRIINVEIYDVYGRKVLSHTANLSPHTTLNISTLSSGVYFIRLMDEQGCYMQRFIKE